MKTKQYLKMIHEKFGYFGTWFPSNRINLGDIGMLNGYVFEKLANLNDLGISFGESLDERVGNVDFLSDRYTTIRSKPSDTEPREGSHLSYDQAGIEIEVPADTAVLIDLRNCTTRRINQLTVLAEEIERRFNEPGDNEEWKREWMIVTEVVEAAQGTLIGFKGPDAKISISTAVNAKRDLAGLYSDTSKVVYEKGCTWKLIGAKGLTPLFKLSGIQKSWWNRKGNFVHQQGQGSGVLQQGSIPGSQSQHIQTEPTQEKPFPTNEATAPTALPLSPFVFHNHHFDPKDSKDSIYQFSHFEESEQILHFVEPESKQVIRIGADNERYRSLWEDFQAFWQVLKVQDESDKPETAGPPQKVHALAIGINNYPSSYPSLQASEADVLRIRTYLEQQPLEAEVETLLGRATKANIVQSLQAIVQKAQIGEAILFYFSGLGQRERLQTSGEPQAAILCADGQSLSLIEIIYLLCSAANKFLYPIIILDMGTQAGLSETQKESGRVAKGIDQIISQRWTDHVFAEALPSPQHLDSFLQSASYVLIQACNFEHETAVQDAQVSLFTANLIEVLSRSQHFLPYPLLQERLTEVLSHQVPQTPDIRVEGPNQALISPNFLGQPSVDFQPMYGRVEWNRRLQQWTIDMGSLFGLTTGQIVHLCSTSFSGNSLTRVEGIYDQFSTLIFGDNMPSRSSTFLGFVDDFLGSPPLQLAIKGWEEDSREAFVRGLIDYFPAIIFQNEGEADYTIQAESEGFSIRSTDEPARIIFKSFSTEPLDQSPGIRTMLRKLVIANALTQLSSNDVTQDPFTTDIETALLYKDGTTEKNLKENEQNEVAKFPTYELDLAQDHTLQVKVTNRTRGRRFIAILLIEPDLATRSLLSPTVISLQPQEALSSISWNQLQSSKAEDRSQLASLQTVKVITSDQPFQLEGWLQTGMNLSEKTEEGIASTVETASLKHDNLWSIQTFQIKSEDTNAWDIARYEGTVESYQTYLSQYPNGRNSEKARLLISRLERISLTHKASPLPTRSSTPKERELSHQIEVEVVAETKEMQSIQSVTYFLHETFNRREVRVSSAETNFALQLDVWGVFTIRATVSFKDGTEIKLERVLDF